MNINMSVLLATFESGFRRTEEKKMNFDRIARQKLSINTLMEEVKPIVMKKNEFKYRDMLSLPLGSFGQSRLWRKVKIDDLSIE